MNNICDLLHPNLKEVIKEHAKAILEQIKYPSI